MKPFVIKPVSHLEGKILLPGDKSIAHRCVIASSISRGITKIENFPANKDCLATLYAFKKLGVRIAGSSVLVISGNGLCGLKKPKRPIFVGDSGTTLRLILGVLAGQHFKTKLITGRSLSRRPMLRVCAPLREMGAKIKAKRKKQNSNIEEYPPIIIEGGNLKPISYRLPVASAQVKSAILLASLYAKGMTSVSEPIPTRDHTERMLSLFKADIKVFKNNIVTKGGNELVSPRKITIPGDISSAAFFIVLAAILPDSKILLKNISLNPSRLGIIRALKRMNAKISISLSGSRFSKFEPMGNIIVRNSSLKGITVNRGEIPSLIDELPILMVAACFAKGKTVLKGVNELRVKETDRINSMVSNLSRMGAEIKVIKDKSNSESVVINGTGHLKGASVKSFQDHRTAMSLIIAGLASQGKSSIDDISCINKSFPDFLKVLNSLIK
jgi:3-phosphoshikimate 1-carboxyvinyltransferase